MMQIPSATCVLFAAGFDWLEALLPFAFVVFWIVSQVFAVLRRLQGGGPRPAPPPRPRFDPARDRPRPAPPAVGDGDDPRSDLEKQIAGFLREATGEKKPRPAPARGEPTEAARPRPPRRDRQTDAERRGRQAPRAAAPVAPERTQVVVPREPTLKPMASVSQPRPENVESVARHVQDAFSHELTHLRGTITPDAAASGNVPRPVAPTQAEELVHLLRNPATIRQVILLREVLDRPVDRW